MKQMSPRPCQIADYDTPGKKKIILILDGACLFVAEYRHQIRFASNHQDYMIK